MSEKARTLTFLLIASGAGMCLWFMTAAVLPDIAAELALPQAQQTALSSAVQAGFVAGALFIAVTGLADLIDPRRLFAACAFGTAGANALLLAAPLDGGLAIALRFLTGALMAGVYPVGMKIAVGWGTADRGLLVGALVGALTLGKSVPYGLAWLGGADWRAALATGSVIAALGAGLVLFTALGPHHRSAPGFRPGAIRLAFTDARIRSAYLGYFGHMWELYIFWAWVGAAATASYLAAGAADPVSLGKLTAFVAIAAGAPACVLAGRWADRIGKARVALWAMASSGTLALLTAGSFGAAPALTFALFVLWGIAVIPDSAQFSALVADYAPPEWAGSLLTFQTALGFLLTVATVGLAPLVADLFGWQALLAGLAIGPAFGVLAMRPLVRRHAADAR
ncbi:MAG: MFS transporter [Paracoccaceae bacterium]|nr:MFS transporter [Paracoccaceae bacterium]